MHEVARCKQALRVCGTTPFQICHNFYVPLTCFSYNNVFQNLCYAQFVYMLYSHPQVVLETEITNKSALKLYENLGFVRDKRLFRYYLNGVDALRLKLWLR